MRVLIDADGCPVVDIAVRLCKKYKTECVIFCDTSHEFSKDGAKTVVVSQGADSVDFALVNSAAVGDIVITQDYGLAAMCLAKCAKPVRQDGMYYTNDNIDALLLSRHTAKKIRRAGGHLKGAPKRDRSEDAAFEKALEALLCGATA